MTADEVRMTLRRIQGVVDLLQRRQAGVSVSPMFPRIADASESQLAALLASDAAVLAVHYQEQA